jgi:glycosyltransferase involved in cell wall biosynthesis
VILPNYNHARFVLGALEAILSQSFPPKEVVVIDDASTDGSRPLLEAAVAGNARVSFLRNERNQGVVRSLNAALSRVSSDFAVCSAADDLFLPGLLERSMDLLSRHPRAGICSSLARVMGENGEDLGPYRTPVVSREPCFIPPERAREIFIRHGTWVVPITVAFRMDALREEGLFDPALGAAADGFMVHVLTLKHGACFIPEPLARWRRCTESYSLKQASDPLRGAEVMRQVEGVIRSRYPGLFPAAYLEAWNRRARLLSLHEVIARRPRRLDLILDLRPASCPPAERLFFRLLELHLDIGRLAARLFHFSQQGFAEQARIVRAKLARFFCYNRPA